MTDHETHFKSVPHPRHPDDPMVTLSVCVPEPGCPGCVRSTRLEEIHAVWEAGSQRACEIIYSLQDGYGVPGYIPAQGYDWSGIRDSSDEAIENIWKAIHS